MWLVFLFLIFIFVIAFSKAEINLYSINIHEKKINFRADLKLKIFGLLKIVLVRFSDKETRVLRVISRNSIKAVNKDDFEFIKKLNIQIDKILFDMKIGLIDVSFTNVAIIIFSTIFPKIIKNMVKMENVKYKVFPKYDQLCLEVKGKISFSFRIMELIKLYYENIKKKNEHNKSKNYGVKESL